MRWKRAPALEAAYQTSRALRISSSLNNALNTYLSYDLQNKWLSGGGTSGKRRRTSVTARMGRIRRLICPIDYSIPAKFNDLASGLPTLAGSLCACAQTARQEALKAEQSKQSTLASLLPNAINHGSLNQSVVTQMAIDPDANPVSRSAGCA